jgi:2-keto-4-pentenoate hydratase/2-oxohepta-3-ene-1,7-dioic acid hydratase in catechol pathway
MRLATALVHDRIAFVPIVDGELCDVSDSGRWTSLAHALSADQRASLEQAGAGSPRLPVTTVRFLPPIPAPERILCIGLNYRDHAAESDQPTAGTEFPVVFTRFASSLVGHRGDIVRPQASLDFDYEGELAVVIGEKARSVSEADALKIVGGYSCFMDGTVRDFQRHTSQFTPGKNFDRSGSFGPWIVTPDEFDASTAIVSTRVNGETLQKAQIGDMIHPIAKIIAYCSSFTTLSPGDVIATGTPGGVGYARQPSLWLRPGDEVEVEVSGLGVLSNRVVAETP